MLKGRNTVRDALVRQWELIADAVPGLEMDSPSRVDGWRNREVVAHLTLQPALLRRFLRTASTEIAGVSLNANLAGTRSLAELIDGAARAGAETNQIDFAAAVKATVPLLESADQSATVVTLQGSIRLVDYLVTRCVEAVVHGADLTPAVEPDQVAEQVAAEALLNAFAERAPALLSVAQELPVRSWIAIATGRQAAPEALAGVVPVMT